MWVFQRIIELLWTLFLIVVGFLLFGVIGAFMGGLLGILSGIGAEIRRGNDLARMKTKETESGRDEDPVNTMLDSLDAKLGGRLSAFLDRREQ